MNKKQALVGIVGILAVAVCIVIPPWVEKTSIVKRQKQVSYSYSPWGYCSMFDPPEKRVIRWEDPERNWDEITYDINYKLLWSQIAAILFFTAGGVYLFKND